MKATLILANGAVFAGQSIGATGERVSEMVFNTSMTGYQEIYTDPSYAGQIIVNTTSHIGNYGVTLNEEEESASIKISGLVCSSFSEVFSRQQADMSLQAYFEKANIVPPLAVISC